VTGLLAGLYVIRSRPVPSASRAFDLHPKKAVDLHQPLAPKQDPRKLDCALTDDCGSMDSLVEEKMLDDALKRGGKSSGTTGFQ
jgi:hypothetical protein